MTEELKEPKEVKMLMFVPMQEEETRLCIPDCVGYTFVHDNTLGLGPDGKKIWPTGGWHHSEKCPVHKKWPRTVPYDATS